MKKNNKYGFTLVELLAVIVILAIILVIAVPKVMSVIEDSKKATLESTAKMIASSAEKAKVQNTVLGKTEEVTCNSVAKLNNMDYASCSIEFEDNTAKVWIEGKGKFEGLRVCGGNKTSSIATTNKCEVSVKAGALYITQLLNLESIQNNGLIEDNSEDNNIRYVGSFPNNQVYFNCKDKDFNNISYGEENYNYMDSCEIWRIIGVFNTRKRELGILEKRIKIVRDEFSIKMSWDSSSNNGEKENNKGLGINQWGESKYEDGSLYEGSDLMIMLNSYYLGNNMNCSYCNSYNQGNCSNVGNCSEFVNPLSLSSKNMIEDVLWNLGGIKTDTVLSVIKMYNEERNIRNGKICAFGDNCNDTVERKLTWIGKVGLIYPSDYGYASLSENCNDNIIGSESVCKEENWLYNGTYWTISPVPASKQAHFAWNIDELNNAISKDVSSPSGVRPTVYLKSSVEIIGGNGNTEPYKLAI